MKKQTAWKRLAAMGMAAAVAVTATACGGSPETAQSNNQDTSADETAKENKEVKKEKIEITFWNSFTGSDGDKLVELVNRFNEENEDGITVNMDISADFDSQLSTAFAGGTGPTMILASSAYRFTYGDYIQDISDIFETGGLDKSDFIQSYLDYCSEGNALYFVPFQIVGYYMYWNKDIFEAAGLDPETPPKTWDEWQSFAEKLTDESQNTYGSGISYDYAYQIAHIMQRFGGLAVTDDNGSWKANFAGNEGYADFLNTYKAMLDNGDNPLEADTDSMMNAGQIGMTIGGPWVSAGLDTGAVNYGIGLIPQGDAGDMNSVEVIGFAVTTAASDAEKEAAYKFIRWWNTEDAEGNSAALEWSVSNGFPAYTYSVQEKDAYKSSEKLSAMSQANPDAPTDFLVDSAFPGINSVINEVLPELMNSVTFDGSSVEDALEQAQVKTEDIIGKYNSN